MGYLGVTLGTGRDRRQFAIVLFCAALFLAWCGIVAYHVHAQHGEALGDWLLDYRQGFIRRGLAGAVLAGLAKLSHLPVLWWVGLAQIAQYAVFLIFFLSILAGRFKPFWFVLLLLSPATLMFSFFEALGPGRKETLHFALLAWFLWGLDRQRVTAWMTAAWVIASACITLSHELNLFYTPYFLIAAAGVPRAERPKAMRAAIWIVVGACVSGAAIFALAKPLDGQAYCNDLMQSGLSYSVCQGIVLWPLQGILSSVNDTLFTIKYFGYVQTYVLALALSLLPVFIWLRRYRPGKVRWHLRWMLVAWACSSLAFLLAVDWGRFIQIHLVSTLLVLSLRLRRREQSVAAEVSVPRFHMPHPRLRLLFAVLCLLSPLFWNMPNCCVAGIGGGVLGSAERGIDVVMRLVKN